MKAIVPFLVGLLLFCGNAMSQEKASASQQTPVEPIYRVGGGVRPPYVIYSPHPDYPEQARKGHPPGPIELWLIVGSDGQPRDVKVKLGISPEIDHAAVEAVEKWKFRPATKDRKPVAVAISVHFDFQPK
jgi:protein TonB